MTRHKTVGGKPPTGVGSLFHTTHHLKYAEKCGIIKYIEKGKGETSTMEKLFKEIELGQFFLYENQVYVKVEVSNNESYLAAVNTLTWAVHRIPAFAKVKVPD